MRGVSGLRSALIFGAAALAWAYSLPAAAAGLGGDCCADLEERIAELEATAARKGTRNVSLTIAGWVNEEIAFWDDGTERDAYVGTNPVQQSRFKFLGEARIDKDWSAGYLIEIGVNGYPGGQWDQTSPSSKSATTPDNGVTVRRSSWHLKNNKYGRVLVGMDAVTTYHLLAESDSTMTRKIYHDEAQPDFQAKFFIRDRSGNFVKAGGSTPLRWNDVLRGYNNSTPGNGVRRNIVRYDSPTISGFTASASWGESNLWDTTLVYQGAFGDFLVNGRTGYGHSSDGASTQCHTIPTAGENGDCTWWGVSGFVQHKPTGMFVLASYGEQIDDSRAQYALQPNLVDNTDTTWFVQAGVEYKWNSLGKTNIFGEYRHDDPGSNVSASGVLRTQGAEINFWTAGAIQHLDSADAMLYLLYQHADGNVEANLTSGLTNVQINQFQQVIAGVRYAF
ncbi:MAG TPA: porin [Hyphomicrobium sp.]|jgi:predicted porin|nr:porin [Hyphomicrobium sp.]